MFMEIEEVHYDSVDGAVVSTRRFWKSLCRHTKGVPGREAERIGKILQSYKLDLCLRTLQNQNGLKASCGSPVITAHLLFSVL